MQWFVDHQAVVLPAVAGLIASILDLAFALSPKARANGVLHWVFLKLGGKETPINPTNPSNPS